MCNFFFRFVLLYLSLQSILVCYLEILYSTFFLHIFLKKILDIILTIFYINKSESFKLIYLAKKKIKLKLL